MFWGAFSYDKKGPCHVWEKETAQEKKDRKDDLNKRNSLREKANKQKWMKDQKKWLQEYVKTHSRKPGGTRKKWVHNKANRVYIIKNGRGGIN